MSAEAFTQLVDAHYASLYRFALSLARNAQDASDLVQQTYFIWATKGESLRDHDKVKTWLFTTLYREFLRTRRRDARVTSLDALPESERDVASEDLQRVSKLDGAAVMQALQRVEEPFRAPLTLFYLQDLSYREIADILSVPIGTVMSRLSRGKAQLRAALDGGSAFSGQIMPFPKAQ